MVQKLKNQSAGNRVDVRPAQHTVLVWVLPYLGTKTGIPLTKDDLLCQGEILVSDDDTEIDVSRKITELLRRTLPMYDGGFEFAFLYDDLFRLSDPHVMNLERLLFVRLTSPYPTVTPISPALFRNTETPLFLSGISKDYSVDERYISFSNDGDFSAGPGMGPIPNLTPIWKNLPEPIDPMDYLHRMIAKNLSNFEHVPKLVQTAELIASQAYFEWLEGMPISHPGHLIIQGNPGVGKTTGAWALAGFLAEAGISKSAMVIEAHRDDLVDRFVGGTEFKTNQVIRAAHGGVIIFDEVYTLNKQSSVNDFGKEALTTIMKYMMSEDAPIFMFLGYKKLMEEFVSMNLGFQRRIKYTIHLEDYSPNALADITRKKIKQMSYEVEENIAFERYFSSLPSGYVSLRNASVAVILIDKATDRARKRTLRLPHNQRKGVSRKLLKTDFDDAHKSLLEEAKQYRDDDNGGIFI